MDAATLQDIIQAGLGTAARSIGLPANAYRASSAFDPISIANRYMQLNAAFSGHDGHFIKTVGYGEALWHGVFDAAYTQVGDYLIRNDATWFIAAQDQLLPPLCVKTNRIVTFSRPAAQSAAGVNTYGGVTRANTTALATNWPASVLGDAGGGRPNADLPSDSSVSYWTVLMPAPPGVVLQLADLMADDLGRTAVVAAVELTSLGWRITVKQAST